MIKRSIMLECLVYLRRGWRFTSKNWTNRITAITLVLGLISLALEVGTKVFGKSAEVVVTGDYVLFEVAEDFRITKSEGSIIKREKIEELLPRNDDSYATSHNILTYIQTAQPTIPVERLNNLSVMMTFKIRNSGNQEAQNIDLEVPVEGFYKVIRIGQDSLFAQIKNRQINVGSIRPAEEILVAVWGDKPVDIGGRIISDFPQSSSVVVHFNKDEITYAYFPSRYYGYWDLLGQHLGTICLLLCIAVLGILFRAFSKNNLSQTS